MGSTMKRKLKQHNINKLKPANFRKTFLIYQYLKGLQKYKDSAIMFYSKGMWRMYQLGISRSQRLVKKLKEVKNEHHAKIVPRVEDNHLLG